jgi:diguanylate cyclase (GGDEF)-like protein/PAS domain S-box-containing protein
MMIGGWIIMRTMKLFLLFAFFLFMVISYKTYEQYQNIQNTQKLIVLKESQSLAAFISAFRQTYQDAFLSNHIEVNKKTINLLPVKTITEISERFSSIVEGDIVIRTVSDRPRNSDNMANIFEQKMIRYFKDHSKEKERFLQEEKAYYYTQPLRIKASCLKCHGKREDTIPSIRDQYSRAYDYKLGEIRGLLNIEIKKRDFFAGMYTDFTNTLLSAIFLYIVFLIIIYLLIREIRQQETVYTQKLETDIEKKTYEIQKQKDTFKTLFEKSSDGILIIDEGRFIQCNEKILEMLHYHSKEGLLNVRPSELSPEFQPDGRRSDEKAEEMIIIAQKKGSHQFEWVHTKSNGKNFVTEVTLTAITLNNRNVLHVIWRDISEKKKAQQELLKQKDILDYQAHHDGLTDLPNRVLFNDRLEHGIELAKRHSMKLALFFIDLDYFKQINDSLGHQVGDKVLIAVAERLKAKIRSEDTLARLGGDEFTIIIEDLKDVEDASLLARKIQEVLTQPIHIEGHTLYTSCSIGISIYPQDDNDANNLIKYADAAMYKAKEEGRNNFQFYASEMTEFALERIVMKSSLRDAIDDEEFILYYQPQVDATVGKLTGMEALIRWQHPKMGLIHPQKFIILAEETGLIVEIDRWVMSTAMKQMTQWYHEGLEPGVLALNLSMRQLRSDDFIDILEESMKAAEFKPEWLEFEVTEGEVMKKPEESIMKLEEISCRGINITIDDFGTGYSSLAYLKRLPVSKLKIDQSFVQGLPNDKEDAAIVKAIIALAESLGLDLIAEGVETDAQKEFLLASGCKQIQGHYYCEAVPAEEIGKKCFDL